MRALVIGSEGNIGRPLVEHLRDVGHEVHEADIRQGSRDGYSVADINHPLDLLDSFDWGPDIVYLLAGVVSRVTCEQAGSLALTTNLGGVNNVVALTKRVGARLVYFSSSEVYGPTEGVMDEDGPCHPNNRYGLSKYLGEQIVEYEVRAYGLRAVTVRPCMIYDEHEDLGDHRSAMIRFAERLSEGLPVDVHAGTARSWLHISDAVRVLERLVGLDGYHRINIGHPEIVATERLAEMIRSTLGASPDLLRFVPQPERMTPVKQVSLRKQAELLDVYPAVGIEEGVARVCARFAR